MRNMKNTPKNTELELASLSFWPDQQSVLFAAGPAALDSHWPEVPATSVECLLSSPGIILCTNHLVVHYMIPQNLKNKPSGFNLEKKPPSWVSRCMASF